MHAEPPATPERARAELARPIALAAEDVRAFPDAPAGFDTPRPGAPQGRLETFAYTSSVTGTQRLACVYLPPGFAPEQRYPVLYLLHGIAGNQYEWTGYVHADAILDQLIADGRARPMIVVMPNGRALPDDRPPPSEKLFTPENVAGFARFERDLFDCLIPAIDAKYPTLADRAHRALAGLSMGGGQTLDFGLGHTDTFAWLGAFSAAPSQRPPGGILADPAAARTRLRLLYLSCGRQDGLIRISQDYHALLRQQAVPHVWNVDDAGHDRASWANNLHHFAQLIFR